MSNLEKLLTAGAKVLKDEPLKNHISFKVGGPAEFMVLPGDISDVKAVLSYTKENEIPLTIMGFGSNILVPDGGLNGITLKLQSLSSIKLNAEENSVTAGAGAALTQIAVKAMGWDLSGFSFAYGIPGSLGGGVLMNAGAFGGEMKEVVSSTTFLNPEGEEKTLYGAEHGFSYRHSAFQGKNAIILESTISLKPRDKNEIKKEMDEILKRRQEKQPLNLPSAGSTFKRPEGHFAGKLIEDAGLKGFKIGGAMVSDKHAGFIVNTGDATASDIKSLIDYVKDKVLKETGVLLSPEVKMIGF